MHFFTISLICVKSASIWNIWFTWLKNGLVNLICYCFVSNFATSRGYYVDYFAESLYLSRVEKTLHRMITEYLYTLTNDYVSVLLLKSVVNPLNNTTWTIKSITVFGVHVSYVTFVQVSRFCWCSVHRPFIEKYLTSKLICFGKN